MRVIRQDLIRAHAPRRMSIRCMFADLLVRNMSVPVVFFYEYALDADVLAHALGAVLGEFCVFNASVRKEKEALFLDCNDTGVGFSVVKRDCTLLESLQGLATEEGPKLVDLIDAPRATVKSSPVLTVRVTHFADGKSCLGVCWHHSVGDMHSFMCFMKAWSQRAANQPFLQPIVIDNREDYLDTHLPRNDCRESALRYLGVWELGRLLWYLQTEARKQQSLSFYFTPEELATMRRTFLEESDEPLSMNDVLCSHVFNVINAVRSDTGSERGLSISVNYRARVGIPDTVLGNLLTTLNLRCESGAPASAIAGSLRRDLKRFKDDHLDYHATLDFARQRGGARNILRFVPKGIDPLNGTLLISNWGKFGVYDIGFGRGSPLYFTGVGEVPFPWLSSIFEGFGNEGAIFNFIAPPAIAAALLNTDGLRKIHRYRNASAQVPELVNTLRWMS